MNEVHVFLEDDEENGFYIEETLKGSRIRDVINGVQYSHNDLTRRIKKLIDSATKRDEIKPREGVRWLDFYEEILESKTYLNIEHGKKRKRRKKS